MPDVCLLCAYHVRGTPRYYNAVPEQRQLRNLGGPLKVYLSHRCETFGPIFSPVPRDPRRKAPRGTAVGLPLSEASRLTRPERSRLLRVSVMTLLVT